MERNEANLICHACARATEYYLASEVDGDVYIVQPGEVLHCGHCGRQHSEGYEMETSKGGRQKAKG